MNSLEQMSKAETLKLREKHIGKSCQLFFRTNPLKIVRGEGQYMFDEMGERYLDCINNVAHVGHCHPKVVQAGCQQMALLSTNNRFLHDELVLCARRLSSLLPAPLSVCYLVNSGSEANDLAMRLARAHTGNKDVVTLEHAYHGHVTTMIDISPYKFNLPGAPPKPDWVHVAPSPDTYRGQFRASDLPGADFGKLYADAVRDICNDIAAKGKGVAAFIGESLISCGGQVLPPPNYLENVYKYVRKHGGVCIADEVQVGFGRTGKWWAFQLQGSSVVPDIVTIGKPMGNGHPVAAVVTTPEIARSFQNTGVEYFNTYGGNPVSCAIANAVMEVLETGDFLTHATVVGNQILDGFRELQKTHKIIGDVRGAGLFVGMELVEDRETKKPATEKAKWVVNRMRSVHHTLISSDGPHCNVLKVKPPMVFTSENAQELLEALGESLRDLQNVEDLSETEVSKVIRDSAAYAGVNATIACHTPNGHLATKRDSLVKSI